MNFRDKDEESDEDDDGGISDQSTATDDNISNNANRTINKNKLEHTINASRTSLNTSNLLPSPTSSCRSVTDISSNSGSRRSSTVTTVASSHGASGRIGNATSFLSIDNVSCSSQNNNNNNIEINDFNRGGGERLEGGKPPSSNVGDSSVNGNGSLHGSSLKHSLSTSPSAQDVRYGHHHTIDNSTSSHCSY